MRHGRLASALLAASFVVAPLALSAPPARAATPPARWIAVTVATLWTQPGIARPIDRPALTNPADPRRWLAGMTVTDRRWLVGRLETQALYGTRVYLLGTWGAWSKVAVATQPSQRSAYGYPGWVPTVQLTTRGPVPSSTYAIVRSRTAWVWSSAAYLNTAIGRVAEVSYDTRFAVYRATPTFIDVVTLLGQHRFLRRSDVVLHTTGAPWSSTRAQLVAETRKFVGLPYLWAGTSGFGFDCSGLTYSVHHALGLTIYRDADQQALRGTPVARTAVTPGDLVFFRNPAGVIHHVGVYAGSGLFYESPYTGLAVRLASLSVQPYRSEYSVARRYFAR